MPHRCMDCKNVVESGALDLEKGCPVCGCKKFQYVRPKKKEKEKAPTVAEYVEAASVQEEASPTIIEVIKPGVPEEKKPAPEKKSEPDRVESVRIYERGRYDINLPVLLNRRELVMSKDDGIYIVDLPSALSKKRKKKKA